MEKKEFNKFAVATIKKTASIVSSQVIKKNKLKAKMEEIAEQIAQIEREQEIWEAPIRKMTGGFSTEDLVERVVDTTGKNPITKFILKYPETIIPVAEETLPELPEEITLETTEETEEVGMPWEEESNNEIQ